ncbi:choice-of-anchor I family protein [Paenibacillus wynnii]|uniref:choice-of-anchor I family protein n=1 Tax=Paenibacillus wynnii TaxID=268407 RepID=UPI00068A1E1B|nr:choice-of-anchor I family protein [Paenibacillus wynnii]
MLKSRIISLMIMVCLFPGVLPMSVSAETQPGNHLVINQLYGGGGKSDTPFTHSFIELYNPTNTTIDLSGYTLAYSSNRPNTHPGSTLDASGNLQVDTLNLTGSIPAQHSFLIRGAAETTSTTYLKYLLTAKDLDWSTRYIDNDKTIELKLVDNKGIQVDAISNRATNFNNIGEGDMPAVPTSKQKTLRRINFVDTDHNSSDFELLTWNDPAVNETFINKYFPRSLDNGVWTSTDSGTVNPPIPPVQPKPPIFPGLQVNSINGKLNYIANYQTGMSNSDGGIAEIVKFNEDNNKMYIVNGAAKSIDIVDAATIVSTHMKVLSLEARLDITAMAASNGFFCGDITSIDVNTKDKIIAIAVQGATYKDNGYIVVLDYAGNYLKHFEAGNQPDMVTFTPDSKYILSANEGEPREGYTAPGAVDPKGTVTIVDIKKGLNKASVATIGFEAFDHTGARAALIADRVLLKPNTVPSVDLEPEYITVTENSLYAYVSLQEANAIATLDLKTKTFVSVKGLGFKDHNLAANSLDALKNGKAEISPQNLYGVYMPDGITTTKIDGNQYLFTANEGDAREWGSKPYKYADTGSYTFPGTTFKIDTVLNAEREGLDNNKNYIYGGRSFSIWDAATMSQVYDSGSDFEKITAELYPTVFNSSNNKSELDSRSGKKGPEPEDVKVMKIKGKTYAFIALERIGGIMMYDVTDVNDVKFYDYINLRDFTGTGVSGSGSLAPEGLCLVEGKDSPTGKPLLMVANEVSGNVNLIEIN